MPFTWVRILSPVTLGTIASLVALGLLVRVGMQVADWLDTGPSRADQILTKAHIRETKAETPGEAIRVVLSAYGRVGTIGGQCSLLTPRGRQSQWGGLCSQEGEVGPEEPWIARSMSVAGATAVAEAHRHGGVHAIFSLRRSGGEWLIDNVMDCRQSKSC
jgi:hypothetical protein